MRNSIDAVADRDFALDYLYACAALFVHLSRIGEELVLWTTSEFGFARLPENAATGSSMMPQKLNADVAELARGKAGTAIGRLTGLLATVKSLPLAYDRDLQEDKPPVFAARADVTGALEALAVLVRGLAFDRERMAAACADPLLRATDAAEALVNEGVPFRDAHEQVAAQVRAGTFEAPARPATAARRCRRGGRGGEGAVVVKTPSRLADGPRLPARRATSRADELESVLDLAVELKANPQPLLPQKTLGLVFGQPSTRTRISFATAIIQLGGGFLTLTPDEMQLSRGESLFDTAHVLSRYLDALAIRVLSHDELEAWADAADIPVINALTSVEHPCQALADALTIRERLGGLDGVRIGWVGDGTNVLVSLAELASLIGMEVVAACPEGYEPASGTPVSSCATRARRRTAPTCSSPTSGSRSARRPSARSGCAISSRTASTSRCVGARLAGGDRPPLPAGASRRGDRRGRAVRRALGRVGRGREPPARAEGAARAAPWLSRRSSRSVRLPRGRRGSRSITATRPASG